MAVPKRRRSKQKQRSARSQKRHKATLPQFVTLSNGIRVPRHMVTALNPVYKGIKFLSPKKKKVA